MLKLGKFTDRHFFIAFLVTLNAWMFIGYLLLGTVIHFSFVVVYRTFLVDYLPLEKWAGTFIFLELVAAMILSWLVTKRFVIPWMNKHLLGIR